MVFEESMNANLADLWYVKLSDFVEKYCVTYSELCRYALEKFPNDEDARNHLIAYAVKVKAIYDGENYYLLNKIKMEP